jgi:hypothetical protein
LADPKDKKPESEHPHEDDFPLELNLEHAGDEALPESESTSASMEEFHFSGPAEELDFTEPADFTFPTQPAGEHEAGFEHPGAFAPAEHAEGEHFFGGEEHGFGESPATEEPVSADDAVPDLEAAEEEVVKPKRELPAWVRTVEWVTVSLLAAGSVLAVVISAFWVEKKPDQITLTMNIAFPLMLALIPYALWRSSKRWMTPAGSSIYTMMLAISTAALILGAWLASLEVARYGWEYSKTRVAAAKRAKVTAQDPFQWPKEAEAPAFVLPAAPADAAKPAEQAPPADAAKGSAAPAAK